MPGYWSAVAETLCSFASVCKSCKTCPPPLGPPPPPPLWQPSHGEQRCLDAYLKDWSHTLGFVFSLRLRNKPPSNSLTLSNQHLLFSLMCMEWLRDLQIWVVLGWSLLCLFMWLGWTNWWRERESEKWLIWDDLSWDGLALIIVVFSKYCLEFSHCKDREPRESGSVWAGDVAQPVRLA